MRHIESLSVCVTCLFVVEYGDDESDPVGSERARAAIRKLPRGHSLVATSDEVASFSWSACDLCGSGGGSRQEVGVLAP